MAVMSVLVGKGLMQIFFLSLVFISLFYGVAPFSSDALNFFLLLLFVACAQDLQCGILKANMHDIGSSISAIHDYLRPDYGASCV